MGRGQRRSDNKKQRLENERDIEEAIVIIDSPVIEVEIVENPVGPEAAAAEVVGSNVVRVVEEAGRNVVVSAVGGEQGEEAQRC